MYPFIEIFSAKIPSYGLCMLLGILLVAFLAYRRGKKSGLTSDDVIVITALGTGGAIFAGYILYLFVTYSFMGIIRMISNGDFEFLKNNGIVFYGGLIGGTIGILASFKITKKDVSLVESSFVPFVPLGHAIGRVGCTLAGCCYGMEYDGPLAIYYKNSITGLSPDVGYFPVQLLEALLDVVIAGVLIFYARKKRGRFDILTLYVFMYGIMRIITEMFRGDEIRGIYFGISTSQWISIGMIVASVVRMVFVTVMRKRKMA